MFGLMWDSFLCFFLLSMRNRSTFQFSHQQFVVLWAPHWMKMETKIHQKIEIHSMTAIYISLDSYSSGLWPFNECIASNVSIIQEKNITPFLCEWNEKRSIRLYYAIMYVSIGINHSLDPKNKIVWNLRFVKENENTHSTWKMWSKCIQNGVVFI